MPEALDTSRRGAGLGVLALLVAATLWSLNGPLIKLLTQQHVPPITVACFRSLLGGLVFLPFAARRWQTIHSVSIRWPIAGIITFTVMTASFVIATAQDFAANAILLQYTSPIWVFLLAPLVLKERPGRAEGLVLVISLVGVGIIFGGHPTGDAAALVMGLVSGLGYGSLTVVLRGLRSVSPTVVSAVNALGSGLLLAGPVAIWGVFALTPGQWGLLLLLALVQFTLPYVLFSWGLQRVEAHRAALIVLLECVLNPILTFVIVGEVPPAATLIGGPVILLGVAGWLGLSWRRRTPQPAHP